MAEDVIVTTAEETIFVEQTIVDEVVDIIVQEEVVYVEIPDSTQGPEGPIGPEGPAGPAGPAGVSGTTLHTFDDSFFLDGQNSVTEALVVEWVAPETGHVIEIGIVVSSQCTSGSLLVKVAKNGTKISATELDLSINTSYPRDNRVRYDTGDTNFAFSPGDRIGIMVTTSTFIPLANAVQVYALYKVS